MAAPPPQKKVRLDKVINDPIHGHITLHPLCVAIIDTPQFQRLRYIKQLGGCYFVYPGACHNRFEHSIGVGHLARELVETIAKNQPELNITEVDILCVQIAGLCHDLGHGPFSHMFDQGFIPKIRDGCEWKHEKASVDMFQHLIMKNRLEEEFKKYKLKANDKRFICEMIDAPKKECPSDYPYKGRDKNKEFLYEIVANKRNGIDVDKWDYFARDCYYLGISNNFDHQRFMQFARVLKADGVLQICSRDKENFNLNGMFMVRSQLHHTALQHPVKDAIEIMITEAFIEADEFIRIPGKENKLKKMSECIDDMVAYTKLTDKVFEEILYSKDPSLKDSQKILKKIQRRKFYKCVGQARPSGDQPQLDKSKLDQIMAQIIEKEEFLDGLIEVKLASFDYGMKSENPLDNLYVYRKSDINTAVKLGRDEASRMLPTTYFEQYVRLYCKSLEPEHLLAAERCFEASCEEQNLIFFSGRQM